MTTGAYKEATLLLSSYTKQLETELQNNSFQRAELAQEIASTNEFLAWTLRMAASIRAHDSARLAELLSMSHYRKSATNRPCSWQLHG
jgi:hypothetical protein